MQGFFYLSKQLVLFD